MTSTLSLWSSAVQARYSLVSYASGGVEAVFGLPKSRVVGHPWDDTIQWIPENVVRADGVLPSMVANGIDFSQFDLRFIHPTQDMRTISVSQHLVEDSSGRITAVAGIAEDITERKRREQKLHTLNKRF